MKKNKLQLFLAFSVLLGMNTLQSCSGNSSKKEANIEARDTANANKADTGKVPQDALDNKDGTSTAKNGDIIDNNTGKVLGHDNGDGTWTDIKDSAIINEKTGRVVGWDNGDGTWTDSKDGAIINEKTGKVVGHDKKHKSIKVESPKNN